MYVVHGDDHVGIGTRQDVDGYIQRENEVFIIKEGGVLSEREKTKHDHRRGRAVAVTSVLSIFRNG